MQGAKAVVVWSVAAMGVVFVGLGLFLVGGIVWSDIPATALVGVVFLGHLTYGSYRTWIDWRLRPPEPRHRTGLLDGMDEVLEPFLYWGTMGAVVTFVVAGVVVAVVSLVEDQPFLVILALIPIAIGVGYYHAARARRTTVQRRRQRRA